MRTLQRLLLSFTLLTSLNTLAAVDILSGGFEGRWTDDELLGLSRTYKSRSLYQGAFGFGWCAPWEWRLNFPKPQEPVLIHCDSRDGLGQGQLKKTSDGWVEWRQGLAQRGFDKNGRLRWSIETAQGRTSYHYDAENRLVKQVRSSGESLHYIYLAGTNWIQQIRGRSRRWHYIYNDQNLVEVRTEDENEMRLLWRYRYSALHNLIASHKDDSLQLELRYNETRDQVIQQIFKTGCREDFQYGEPQIIDRRRRQSAAVLTTCPDGKSDLVSTEWVFHQQTAQRWRLTEKRIRRMDQLTEIHYHSHTGLPRTLRHNGQLLTLHYDSRQRLSRLVLKNGPTLHLHYVGDSLEPQALRWQGPELLSLTSITALLRWLNPSSGGQT